MNGKSDSVDSLFSAKPAKRSMMRSKHYGLLKAYSFEPLSSSSIQEDWGGRVSDAFFEKLKDELSRIPGDYFGQIIVVREAREHDRKKKSTKKKQDSFFDPVGYHTKFFLLENDTGKINQFCLARILIDLGIEIIPCSTQEMDQLARYILCPQHNQETIPDVLWEGPYIKSGKYFSRVISLTDPPVSTWSGFLQRLYEMETPFTASIKIHVPDKNKTRKKLETKRKINHALSARSIDEMEDIEANSALESSQLTLERLTTGNECLSQISFSVFLNSDDREALDSLCEKIRTQLSGESGCGFYLEELGSFLVLKSHMPGAQPLPAREIPMLSGNLAHFLPVFYDYNRLQDKSSISTVSRSGEQCHLNLFSENNLNYNAFVCGSSGSGKSFLVNAILASFVEEFGNNRIFIFDIGNSYGKLIDALGGDYHRLDKNFAKKLIVSTLRQTYVSGDPYARVLLENLCGGATNLTHSHRVAIQNLSQTGIGQKFSFKNFAKTSKSKGEKVYKDIALWLEPYFLWDELDDTLILIGDDSVGKMVFDFIDLDSDPQIQKLAILCLAKNIWDAVKQNVNAKTLVVFDEVWKFFASSAHVIEEMYRTFRKYQSGIISITQSLSDYGDAAFAKLIIANSFTRIVLQGGANSTHLADALDLDSDTINRVLSLASQKNQFSEFWVGTPQFSQIMRLIASDRLYAIANTELSESSNERNSK